MTGCAEKEDCREKVGRRVGLKRREEAICPVSRQRDPERAKAREVFGLERAVSCRRTALGRRAKLDFRRGEPLDDLHRSTAVRAAVKVGGVFGGASVLFVRRLLCRSQELPPLFGWFTGTAAQSDFSSTCMSAVRLLAFADRPCSSDQGALEISRFSCMLFLSVRGFLDYAGPTVHSRLA